MASQEVVGEDDSTNNGKSGGDHLLELGLPSKRKASLPIYTSQPDDGGNIQAMVEKMREAVEQKIEQNIAHMLEAQKQVKEKVKHVNACTPSTHFHFSPNNVYQLIARSQYIQDTLDASRFNVASMCDG